MRPRSPDGARSRAGNIGKGTQEVIVRSRCPVRVVTMLSIVLTTTPLTAQQDTAITTLEPVVVTVTRGSGRTILGSPFAISVIRPDSSRPGQRHSAADETLALIPGLTTVSRNNPAQDPRLSIRGFGARSAFGVRGVRVLRDGIPITLADGQTPLDYVSLESVGSVEVLRGAASALYGNASGGVIDLRSSMPVSRPLDAEVKQWAGSDAMSRTVIAASGTSGRAGYIGDVAYSRSDGSRLHSKQRSTTGFARASFEAGTMRYSITGMGFSNPLAENPGALTLEEMRANPEMADAQALRRNARKKVTQVQIGATAERITSSSELTFSAFGGARSLDNPLTFAVIEVGRHTWGASSSFRTRRELFGAMNSASAGIDVLTQNDLRKNFAVCADTVPRLLPTVTCPTPGNDRGVMTLGQREAVSSAGLYMSDDIEVSDRFSVVAAIRADRIRFEVKDQLVSSGNPDDSGHRTLSAVSPVIGAVARVAPTHSIYANFSSAFETPTATELGNHADGTAGINADLDPQRSYSIEGGAKGWLGSLLRYDAAIFYTLVKGELIPFEIPQSNGRRYFRNAGRTRRRGTEVGAELAGRMMSLMVAYSFSQFEFMQYESSGFELSGNEIPGIPRHRLQSALRLRAGRTFVLVDCEAAGRTYLDDANTAIASGYTVTSSRIGTDVSLGRARATIVFGVQNIFDRMYSSSLAVNAARGKYFEPAPGRALFAGLSVGAGIQAQK